MRSGPDAGDVSTGLDLFLLGLVAAIVGNYVLTVSSAPVDPSSGFYEVMLVGAAAAVPAVVGLVVLALGVAVLVGGPLFFWVVWPLRRATKRRRDGP